MYASHDSRIEKANQFANQYLDTIIQMRNKGMGLREIAAEMNAYGYVTRRGSPWTDQTVRQMLKRMKQSVGDAERNLQSGRALKKNADDFAQKFFPLINEMKAHGMNLSEIADKLNAEGYVSRRGAAWTYHSVGEILKRMKELAPQKESIPPVRKLKDEVFGQIQPPQKHPQSRPHEPETRFIGWRSVVTRR